MHKILMQQLRMLGEEKAHVEFELVQVDEVVRPRHAHLPAEVIDCLRKNGVRALRALGLEAWLIAWAERAFAEMSN